MEYRNILSATTMIDDDVKNPKGEDIGKIHEIMIDVKSGEVAYAVLSFGGIMGVGDKYFAIPWKALEIDENEKQFRLDVSKEKLEQAPGFDKDNWPDFSKTDFRHSIDAHYSGTGSHTAQSH